jgi:predicted nucleic acid-binding protein
LHERHSLAAPDLILPECANILWKKVKRGELTTAEARFAARLIEGSNLKLREMTPLFAASIELSVELDHPAYDCTYLVLALKENISFVTADESLVRKLRQRSDHKYRNLALLPGEAAKS